MSLPDMSRLTVPTATPLPLLIKGGLLGVLQRTIQAHRHAMAVHAFHNGWEDYINNLTYHQAIRQPPGVDDTGILPFAIYANGNRTPKGAFQAEMLTAIFAFFAPVDMLNEALGHVFPGTPGTAYAPNSPLDKYATGRHDADVDRLTAESINITVNPSARREFFPSSSGGVDYDPGRFPNPSCELTLAITGMYALDTDEYDQTPYTNQPGQPGHIRPSDYLRLFIEILYTAAKDRESTARRAWNAAVGAIQATLMEVGGAMGPERWFGGRMAQALGNRLKGPTVLWHALHLDARPQHELVDHFIDRMCGMILADLPRRFVSATRNRHMTMKDLGEARAEFYGLRHQICLFVQPDVPVIVVNEFLPTPDLTTEQQDKHPLSRPGQGVPPVPSYETRRLTSVVPWTCGTDDTEVIICPYATYTLRKDQPNDRGWYRNKVQRDVDRETYWVWGLYNEDNTLDEEIDAVRWFVDVTRPR